LGAPALMAVENWDDHDRSDRYLAVAFAKNYLNSCDRNAILFTNGDNDTYPLWYAQNVEGIRTDVRVINLSLLSTDWYINALRRKVFESEPLPLSIPEDKLVTGVREFTRFNDDKKRNQEAYWPLNSVVDFMTSDDRKYQVTYDGSEFMNYMPVHKFSVPVDRAAVLTNGVVKAKDSLRIESEIRFDVGTGGLYKGNLIVLDIIATNAEQGWKRPIYFTTTTGGGAYMGLDEYFRHEGLTFRLVPIKSPKDMRGLIDPDLLYDKLMNVYVWGNMEKGTMNLDEKAQLVPQNLRYLFVQVARDLSVANEKKKAVDLLNRSFTAIPEKIMPMDARLKSYYASTYLEAGDTAKARKVINEITATIEDDLRYYKRFSGKNRKAAASRIEEALGNMNELVKLVAQYFGEAEAKKYEAIFNRLNTSS
jgi:hypothetical protein